MAIHLVTTSKVDTDVVNGIKKQLESVKGPLKFHFDSIPELVPTGKKGLTFNELFKAAAGYRSAKDVPKGDFVLILTDQENIEEYFATLNPENLRDGFVHTDEWSKYIDCHRSIPAAFTVLNIVLLGMMAGHKGNLKNLTHEKSIGCLNDFCDEKREVALKLRTGDICDKCLKRMLKAKITPLTIDQCLRLLEGMRMKMIYRNYFHRNIKPSRIELAIQRGKNHIKLVDYDNAIVRLQDFQMAVYLLFLLHEEGIPLKQLGAAKEELKQHYMSTALKSFSSYEEDIVKEIAKKLKRKPYSGLSSEIVSIMNSRYNAPKLTVESVLSDPGLKSAIESLVRKKMEGDYDRKLKKTLNKFIRYHEKKNGSEDARPLPSLTLKRGDVDERVDKLKSAIASKGVVDQVLSKIRESFENVIGEAFSSSYVIIGQKGMYYKINLPRQQYVLDYKNLSKRRLKLELIPLVADSKEKSGKARGK